MKKFVEESQIKEKINKAHKSIKKKMFSYIAAGLGFVAGLAWNDAIKTMIDTFIPKTENTIIAKLIYAVLVTVIVGLMLFYVEKSLEKDAEK